MTGGFQFQFHGLNLVARSSRALWWADEKCLIVADLHLGKSERMARRGGALLPPYEGRLTLERLQHEIAALSPQRVISLGDAFDDLAAAAALPMDERHLLHELAQGREWLWVSGNHDAGSLPDDLPGRVTTSALIGKIPLRHEAMPHASPDISGHFHPVARLAGSRLPSFLIGENHLILPAFGAYTGGLICSDPALVALAPRGIAAACYENRVFALPL